MKYDVTVYHKDTCISCYLRDHHNRDGECLVGIMPYCQTVEEAREEIFREISDVWYEKVPEAITDAQIKAAIAECVPDTAVKEFYYIDGDGETHATVPESAEDDDCLETAQLWFVMEWTPSEG